MESSAKKTVVGLLVMGLAGSAILLKFNKLPGFRMHGGTNGIEFVGFGGLGGAGSGGGDESGDSAAKPKRGDDLRLCGWSMARGQRLVIVNNETLGVGETVRVELRGERVKVSCLEIRTNSAIFQVDGDSDAVEIFMEAKKASKSGDALAAKIAEANHRAAPVPVAPVVPAAPVIPVAPVTPAPPAPVAVPIAIPVPVPHAKTALEKMATVCPEMPTNTIPLVVGGGTGTVKRPTDGTLNPQN